MGKEYDNHGLWLFEGEYLNNQKWKGKMKSYNEDKLVFEGEYLNGKIWSGKGKEFNYRKIIDFEGEYYKVILFIPKYILVYI